MIELHLIGYTADLEHLVLDLEGADGGRYRLHVDPDVFATLDELREERRAAGLPVGDLVEFADEIGLDVAELARRQAEETRRLAERGLVSAGSSAAAHAPAGGSYLDDPVRETALDATDEQRPVASDPYADLAASTSSGDDEDDEAVDAGLFDDEDDWITVSSDEDEVFAAVDEVGRWADEPVDTTIVLDDAVSAFLSPDSEDGPSESDPEPASLAATPAPVVRIDDPDEGDQDDGDRDDGDRDDDLDDEFRVLDGWDDEDDEDPDVGQGDVAISSTVMLIRDKGRLTPRPAPVEPAVEDDAGLVAGMLDARARTDADTADGPEDAPEPAPEPAAVVAPEDDEDPPAPPSTPAGTSAGDPDGLPVGRSRPGQRTPPRPLTPQPRAERAEAPPSTPPVRKAPRSTPPEALLSPAEIQSRLRSGATVRSVAKAAGTDEEWIRRWEQPIVAERATELQAALAMRLERSRLGRSKDALGRAVEVNLAKRHVAAEDIAWEASRRRDGRWRVAVSYPHRGRKRSATWTWSPRDGELAPASDAARDLGFTRKGS